MQELIAFIFLDLNIMTICAISLCMILESRHNNCSYNLCEQRQIFYHNCFFSFSEKQGFIMNDFNTKGKRHCNNQNIEEYPHYG